MVNGSDFAIAGIIKAITDIMNMAVSSVAVVFFLSLIIFFFSFFI